MDGSMWVGTMYEAMLAISVLQLLQPSLEKSSLRLLLREAERPFVGASCFGGSSQPPVEIRPRRVRQVIVRQIAPREDGIDKGKTRQRALVHRHRYSAVQLDHGRRIRPHQDIIESDDLGPIRGGGAWRLGVHSRDGRLEYVWADPAR